ncbi:MAG: hypothetical protein HWE07_05790 [Cytophagia bacterium]|nr:hypothetical protein [Cytophagia bacterium]
MKTYEPVDLELLKELDERRLEFVHRQARFYMHDMAPRVDTFISELDSRMADYPRKSDVLAFVTMIFNHYVEVLKIHNERCSKPNCSEQQELEDVLFRLSMLLESNDFYKVENERLSNNEQEALHVLVQKINADIEALKMGQEVLYECLSEDIKALTNSKFLGKPYLEKMVLGTLLKWQMNDTYSKYVSPEIHKLLEEFAKSL